MENINTALPNFICGGAPKSGTTTLYDILKEHPEIYLSSFKEPLFFNSDENFSKGVNWYLSTYFDKHENESIIGDFTPSYLCSSIAAKRIFESLGSEVKFLFILRNPIDRAYSHYWHNKRDQIEHLDFGEALLNEEQRMSQFSNENDLINWRKFGYVFQGKYFELVQHYISIFGKKNIKILVFEDTFENLETSLVEICNFLQIDPTFKFDLAKKSNTSSVARSKALKRLIKKKTVFKKILKFLFPSAIARKKLRNLIQTANNKSEDYRKLTKEERAFFYEKYFKKDTDKIEKLLERNLDIWRE